MKATITNTNGKKIQPNSEIIIPGLAPIEIPEKLDCTYGNTLASKRIDYALVRAGYMRTEIEAIELPGGSLEIDVEPCTMVSAIELAEHLWPGCTTDASREELEKVSSSARRWARRMEQSFPSMAPRSRVDRLANEQSRAVLVWPLEVAMKIRGMSRGSGNWKRDDDADDGEI